MSPSSESSSADNSPKFDAQKASGRVVRHLEKMFGDDVVIIGPSAEYQGTRIGWWTVRLEGPATGTMRIEWALWACQGQLRLSLRLPGGSGQPRKAHSAKGAALQIIGALSGMELLAES